MKRWRARAYLVIFAAACIAAGIVVPFVSANTGRDILAGIAIVGGLAMLVVALASDRGE